MFLSSYPPIVSAHSTFSIPTYNDCQYTGHKRENEPSELLVKQERIEIVGESDGRERPGSVKTGTIRVAPADSVRTDQGDDFLVSKATEGVISTTKRCSRKESVLPHTVEDIPDVRSALGSIGKAAIRGSIRGEAIDTSWPPRDFRSSHLLNGGNTTKGPQVTVADPGEFGLDLLQQGSGNRQTVIGTMESLGFETHGSEVAIHFTTLLEPGYGRIRGRMYSPSASAGFLVIRSRRMPSESKNHWTVGTVVVPRIASIVQDLGNPVVDLQIFTSTAVRHVIRASFRQRTF